MRLPPFLQKSKLFTAVNYLSANVRNSQEEEEEKKKHYQVYNLLPLI